MEPLRGKDFHLSWRPLHATLQPVPVPRKKVSKPNPARSSPPRRRTGKKKGAQPPLLLLGGVLALLGAGTFWFFAKKQPEPEDDDVRRELVRILKENPEAEALGLAPEEKKK